MKLTKIYYWSPFLSPIATCKAVLNSAYSLNKYGERYQSFIINFYGEFDDFKSKNEKNNFIDYYNLNLIKKLPYKGKIKSRLSFILMFFLGFIPLRRLIKKNKPDYLIIHLITSLPLILLIFFNFETKFILRISGYPRMNFLRKYLWKIAFKKIHLVTCPTNNTLEYIKRLNLVDDSKLKLLYDPVITLKEIIKKRKKLINYKNYYIAIGRLTAQKNFIFLCKAFQKIVQNNSNLKLLIAGNGEQESEILNFIRNNKLEKNIILIGFQNNIFPYLKSAKGFISTSLWEDPGFVLIEAGICRTPVLTSDTWPGPVEIIKDNYNGFRFKSNNITDFKQNFEKLENSKNLNEIILNNLKFTKNFTLFSHYLKLNKILSDKYN